MFSSCLLWSGRSPVREKGERGTSCEGQLGLMDTLLRRYRAEDTGLKTVIPSLTLVIMGALFDLRRDPPPAPPPAHAHWSTSIRSIAPGLAAQSGRPPSSCWRPRVSTRARWKPDPQADREQPAELRFTAAGTAPRRRHINPPNTPINHR